jgi:hypothetical protein
MLARFVNFMWVCFIYFCESNAVLVKRRNRAALEELAWAAPSTSISALPVLTGFPKFSSMGYIIVICSQSRRF